MLVEAGVDVGVKNGVGHTAVYEAEVGGKDEVVKYLLGVDARMVEDGEEEEVGEGENEVVTKGEDDKGEAGEGGDGENMEGIENGVEGVKLGRKDDG